eukprot:m.22421 g.22421  ORF g.22421 m.22421 type:complete len:201 (-) comp11249_c0_seq1:155-757(-)
MASVFVKTEDDHVLEMTRGVADMAITLKNMMEDFSDEAITKEDPIPLSNIKKPAMEFVINWCVTHQDDDLTEERFEEFKTSIELFPEDQELFGKLDCPGIFSVIKAANFLDVARLLDYACKALVLRINGKTLEENAKQFNITREITMEDKIRAIEKHPWILTGCNLIPAHIEMKNAYYEKYPEQRPASETDEAADEQASS